MNGIWGFYFSMRADSGTFFKNYFVFGVYVFMSCLATLPSMCVCVLVQVLVVLTASLFNILSLRIVELKEMSCSSHHTSEFENEALIGLNDWKMKHWMLTQLVDRINECFGLVTLLAMMRGFISIMVSSYNMVIFDSNQNGLDIKIYSWASIVLETFYLLLPIAAAWYLEIKVLFTFVMIFQLLLKMYV